MGSNNDDNDVKCMLLCEEKSGWLKGVISLVNHGKIASDAKDLCRSSSFWFLGSL